MFDENGSWLGGGIGGASVTPPFASLSPYMTTFSSPALNTVGAVTNNVRPDFWSLDGMMGYRNKDGTGSNGWGGMALGVMQGLGSAFMGMKQYGLAKEQLQFAKDSFEKNYAAQRSITNANLEDRQRARVASNPGAYQSVGDYMAQNGIK